jgi:hypothetical protein
MLSIGNTGSGSGASLSLDVRAAVGAGVLAANGNASSETPASTDAVTLPDQRASAVPTYNAFEFTYRSDYGKVILREQNVDTGQEVVQIPSEYHLQQYAATQRAQRVQQQAALYHLGNGGSQPRSGGGTKTTASTTTTAKAATTSTGQSAPAPAAAPAAAAAPAPVVAAEPAPAHVDIKV